MKHFVKETLKIVIKAALETFVTEASRLLAERIVKKRDDEEECDDESPPSKKHIQ